jgi:hypothetical protein
VNRTVAMAREKRCMRMRSSSNAVQPVIGWSVTQGCAIGYAPPNGRAMRKFGTFDRCAAPKPCYDNLSERHNLRSEP